MRIKSLFIICVCLIFILSLPFFGWAKDKKEKTSSKVYYIAEKDLPRRLAILYPFSLKKEIDSSIFPFIRAVVQNYLAGKGYSIIPFATVDTKVGKFSVSSFSPQKVFKNLPDADGILTISVYQLSQLNIALVKHYKIDAEVCLYNKKKKLGCWRETASRKNVSIAVDPLGAIAAVVSSALSSSGDLHIKNLVFEWAFKISSLIPGFSAAAKKPKILRVVTNITSKPFKLGDKIMVGLEGEPGLTANFDLGTFRKNIPMSEVQPGIYKGVYVVQKGDNLKNGILVVHLIKPDGQKRDWIEVSSLINIDGCPPQTPKDLKVEVKERAIRLTWQTQDIETVEFLILRSENPLSEYKEIAKVKQFNYEDKDVFPGKKYFYRVIALDASGNLSPPAQYGPVSLPVLKARPLPETITGTFSSGRYLLEKTVTIPFGMKAQLGPDIIITCAKKAKIVVEGELRIVNAIFMPKQQDWLGIIVMPLGKLEMINTNLSDANIAVTVKGSAFCQNLTIKKGNTGLIIDSTAKTILKQSMFMQLDTGVEIKNGNVQIIECNFEKNNIAIKITGGQVFITKNNFWQNKINIQSQIPLFLKANYLGSTEPTAFRLKGKIEIKSFLTAPYPQGEEKVFKPEELKKQAEILRKKGINALNAGNYGQAYEFLEKSLKTWPDKDTYIYFIYTLSLLGEDAKLKDIIVEAIKKYPYEIKLYQLSVRYYLQKNQKEEARKLLEKGLKLNPNNPTLKAMLPLVEEKENTTQPEKTEK